MTIDEAFTRERLKLPKWNKIRTIYLSDEIREELERHREKSKHNGPDDFIFSHEYRNHVTRIGYSYLKRHLEPALKAAKIQQHFTTQDFRHSLNTHLLAAGVDPVLVQIYLGWTSRLPFAPVQLNHYTNLSVFNLKPVAEAIDKIYAPGKEPPPLRLVKTG